MRVVSVAQYSAAVIPEGTAAACFRFTQYGLLPQRVFFKVPG